MPIKKIMLGYIVLFSIFNLGTANAKGGWTGWVDVDRIYSHTQLYFTHFLPAAAHVNPDGCVHAKPYQFDRTQENSKEVFQMLLTSKASGMKVRAFLYGCLGNYPRVLYLEVR